MKYIMPTKGVGFRKLINKRFDTALVHEFRTSKLHNGTYKECNVWIPRNPIPIPRFIRIFFNKR
jgi:hypothetical protein